MKRNVFIIIVCLLSISVKAQSNDDDFQTFRMNILENYQGFRKSILDGYAKFLNGIWEDYQLFAGKKLHLIPKPKEQPEWKGNEPIQDPQLIEPEIIIQETPLAEEKPSIPKPIIPTLKEIVSFEWCGMTIQLPDAKIEGNLNGVDKECLVDFFELLRNSRLDKEVLPQIELIIKSTNLNDWCIILLIQSYVKIIKENANTNTRNMICWYMMALFGYDIRLALNGNNLFYLIPFQQEIYEQNYISIKNTPYYIFGEGIPDYKKGFYTPDIPDNVGTYVNAIMLHPLDIPYCPKKYAYTFAGQTLSGEVNENLVKLMSLFPLLPTPAYAISQGDTKAREQVLSQMRQFIVGMSELDAANFILQFIQSFEYATDDEQFGHEKPFFFEETLYYPKCDCEDRAIFYHFLITNLLGKDVHLVHYPNHECNAVNFSQTLNADSYMFKGKQYVICDPTYIGATIGMCMPYYKDVKPEIEIIDNNNAKNHQ